MPSKNLHGLNIFAGPDAVLDYLDPAKHPPTSLVELPREFIRSKISLPEGEKVRIFLKMLNEVPLGTGKLIPVLHWWRLQYEAGRVSRDTTGVISSSGGAALPFTVGGRRYGARVKVIMPKGAPVFKRMIVELANGEPVIQSEEIPGKTETDIVRELAKLPNHIVFSQYGDPTNTEGHKEVTAAQIWEQIEALGIGLSGIVFGVGTSGTGNAIVESIEEHGSDAIPVGVICAEGNSISGMRPLSRLDEELVPLFHQHDYSRFVVKQSTAYKYAVDLLREVGLRGGITTGAVLDGIFHTVEKFSRDSVAWKKTANENGEHVFVGIAMDSLELYIPELSKGSDSSQL